MSLHFTTESGAHYEVMKLEAIQRDDHPPHDELRMRRIVDGDSPSMRADGDWVQLIRHTPITTGDRVVLVMESLDKIGPDDYGTRIPSGTTTRATTPVVRVWGEL